MMTLVKYNNIKHFKLIALVLSIFLMNQFP